MDLVVLVADVHATPGPLEPVLLRLVERNLGIDRVGRRLVRREPRQRERDPRTGPQDELGYRRHLLSVHFDRRPKAETVRPGDRDMRIFDPSHPRDDRPVVERDYHSHATGDTP